MKPSTGKRVKETTQANDSGYSPRRIITPNAPGFPSHLSKWAFAIGTTSRVPDGTGYHYLILDIDEKPPNVIWPKLWPSAGVIAQETQSGWHVYTPFKIPNLRAMLEIARTYGADPVWCSIAAKRGYAFLADKSPVELPWPVERMVIGK